MKGSAEIRGWSVLAGWIMILLLFSSCHKSEQVNLNPSLNVADDIIISQRSLVHSLRMLVRAVNDTILHQTSHQFFDGASVGYSAAANSYTFTYYGTSGPDGVVRSGTVAVTLSGNLYEQGTTAHIVMLNYLEDGMRIQVTDSLVSHGIAGEIAVLENRVPEGTVLKDTSGTIHFESYLDVILPVPVTGENEQAWMQINGILGGTSSGGFAFSAAISYPVKYAVYSGNCAWMREGLIPFYFSGDSALAGTIFFPPVTSCNDSVYYDFGETIYRWRMQMKYLKH